MTIIISKRMTDYSTNYMKQPKRCLQGNKRLYGFHKKYIKMVKYIFLSVFFNMAIEEKNICLFIMPSHSLFSSLANGVAQLKLLDSLHLNSLYKESGNCFAVFLFHTHSLIAVLLRESNPFYYSFAFPILAIHHVAIHNFFSFMNINFMMTLRSKKKWKIKGMI